MSAINAPSQSLEFLQKCTAVKVAFGNLSFTKKLPKAAVQTESNPERISASKRLLECAEADAIKNEFTRLRQYVVSRTLPSPFGSGIYFVPNTLMAEVDAELSIAERETIPQLGERLIAVLDQVLIREAEALGPNYNASDYDTPAEIRSRLKVDYAYVTFGIPENLPNAMYAREQDKARAKLTEAVDTMQDLLRSEFAKLISHAAEKLSGTKEDGKKLVFRNSLVTNIKEFLQLFKDRNITSDTELEALCDRAKSLLDGVDPQDLREHEPLRDTVARGFAEMKSQLDGMMVPKGNQRIIFAEEDSAAA